MHLALPKHWFVYLEYHVCKAKVTGIFAKAVFYFVFVLRHYYSFFGLINMMFSKLWVIWRFWKAKWTYPRQKLMSLMGQSVDEMWAHLWFQILIPPIIMGRCAPLCSGGARWERWHCDTFWIYFDSWIIAIWGLKDKRICSSISQFPIYIVHSYLLGLVVAVSVFHRCKKRFSRFFILK